MTVRHAFVVVAPNGQYLMERGYTTAEFGKAKLYTGTGPARNSINRHANHFWHGRRLAPKEQFTVYRVSVTLEEAV